MNDIEKMYKNAGIEKRRYCFAGCKYTHYNSCDDCNVADKMVYPPFTAEKQLELLKICFDKYGKIGKVSDVDRCILYITPDTEDDKSFTVTDYINFETWEESIAGLVNYFWKDLTEEEKQQIKEILDS